LIGERLKKRLMRKKLAINANFSFAIMAAAHGEPIAG